MSPEAVAHGIQLALAPVFLLTAIAGMIGVLTGRLARIIDRGRAVESTLEAGSSAHTEDLRGELPTLHRRAKLVNVSLGVFAGSAICVGITTAALFLSEVSRLHASSLVAGTFLGALGLFMLGLLLYLAEVRLSRHTYRFGRYLTPPSQ